MLRAAVRMLRAAVWTLRATSRMNRASKLVKPGKATSKHVKGYGVDVKGYSVDVKGYGADVKGYGKDVKGYTVRMLRATVRMVKQGDGERWVLSVSTLAVICTGGPAKGNKSQAGVKGYGVDVKGCSVDVKGYGVDVKGYGADGGTGAATVAMRERQYRSWGLSRPHTLFRSPPPAGRWVYTTSIQRHGIHQGIHNKYSASWYTPRYTQQAFSVMVARPQAIAVLFTESCLVEILLPRTPEAIEGTGCEIRPGV
eukprot:1175456-Prorocentrum_minimum.AAC.7